MTPLFRKKLEGDPATEKERYLVFLGDLTGCFCFGLRGWNVTLAGFVVCSILENCYIWHLRSLLWGANNIANLVSILAALVLLVLSHQSQKCLQRIGIGGSSVHAEQPIVVLAGTNPQPSYFDQQQESPISSTETLKEKKNDSEDEQQRLFEFYKQKEEQEEIDDIPKKPDPDAKIIVIDGVEFVKALDGTVKKVDDDND